MEAKAASASSSSEDSPTAVKVRAGIKVGFTYILSDKMNCTVGFVQKYNIVQWGFKLLSERSTGVPALLPRETLRKLCTEPHCTGHFVS